MDTVRGADGRGAPEDADGVGTGAERTIAVGTDERRMHVRAYNHWVSLLRGRAYPAIEDLDPGSIADFGPNSVLLDFTDGVEDPAIRFLGRALRTECGVTGPIARISEVPGRSLLSRLTDHYLQIIANRAPIGFEAEFIGTRGHPTMYRGILMPFSSDEDTIDFIYGVINWKELVDAELQAQLTAELEASRRAAPRRPLAAPAWEDGPSAGIDERPEPGFASEADAEPEPEPAPAPAPSPLADQLLAARETAAAVRTADSRSRAALYRALGRAYDFALAAEAEAQAYALLLAHFGLKAQARAPMTPIAKLVFGTDHDKARLTEYAAVLSHARRHAVRKGGLPDFVEAAEGGIKAIVRAERVARRPDAAPEAAADPVQAWRAAPSLAALAMPADSEAEFVLLLARAGDDGTLDVLASLDDDGLTARAMLRARR